MGQLSIKCLPIYSVDCQWKDYGAWSACSKKCGGGDRFRKRNKKTEANNGGKECLGEDTETETCNTITCPGKTLNFRLIS